MGKKRVVHDGGVVQLATRIPVELHKRVKLHCIEEELMMQSFVEEAIAEYLKAHPAREGRNGNAEGAD